MKLWFIFEWHFFKIIIEINNFVQKPAEVFIIIPQTIVPGLSKISSNPDKDSKHNLLAKVLMSIPPSNVTW